MPMETTVPTETVTKVIEVVEQMDYTEYLVKLVNSNELILDAVHVLSGFALFAIVVCLCYFLNIIFQLLEWLLRMLPEISFSADWGTTSTFFGVVRCVLYMLPLNTISAIVGLLLAISGFRVIIAIVKTIWDLLPLV